MFRLHCDWCFAIISKKYKKWDIFWQMAITLGVNMITRKMTPFFHLLFKLYWLLYFIFAFKDLQNSVTPLHFVLFCKIHIHMPHLKPVNMYIFLYIKFANFWYIIKSVPNLIPIWSCSDGLYLPLTVYQIKNQINLDISWGKLQ